MEKFIIAILVSNHAGVLSRVTGMFTRRGFNIDSLTVGETESPEFSRITISLHGDKAICSQIVKRSEPGIYPGSKGSFIRCEQCRKLYIFPFAFHCKLFIL